MSPIIIDTHRDEQNLHRNWLNVDIVLLLTKRNFAYSREWFLQYLVAVLSKLRRI